jgi:hypothetical protein
LGNFGFGAVGWPFLFLCSASHLLPVEKAVGQMNNQLFSFSRKKVFCSSVQAACDFLSYVGGDCFVPAHGWMGCSSHASH